MTVRLPHLRALVPLGVLLVILGRPARGDEAELPRVLLDTTYSPPTGRTLAVPAGGDFQTALDAARPGDVITLEAGATFLGPFVLPKKEGSDWIIVRTSAPDTSFPRPGTRVGPSHAALMPKLVVPPGVIGGVITAPGAHHFRFVAVEFKPVAGAFVENLLVLSVLQPEDEMPHDLVVDRCYLHGDPVVGGRRGIVLNSGATAVIDSYVADFKQVGADSESIMAWNGPGPFKIVNNYLEAASANLLFGGADPTIPDLVPSDIEIRHNHFTKPLAWRSADPPWTVKNLLTLKNARRVLIDGNVFEHNWLQEQEGTAVIFTVRNQSGTAPWSTVEDVTFTNNIVRHTGSAIGMHGWDDLFPSQLTRRILIRNNLFHDVSGARWGGAGHLFEANKGIEDLVIDHNTAFQEGAVIRAEGGCRPVAGEPCHARFVFRNNLTLHGDSGVIGSGTETGLDTLDTYFPSYVFERNVLVGGDESLYPRDNFFPASVAEVGFVDLARGDYRLTPSSPYKGDNNVGTDGKDLGVDVDALQVATAGVIGGVANDVCAAGQPSRRLLWPPNHELVPVDVLGLTDPSCDRLTIAITRVTQDEPVNGLGDGDTSPDAFVQGGTVLLRAERSGTRDGRVYRAHFTVHDGLGEICTGSVTVGVPHSPKRGLPADDGQRYTSTQPLVP